MRKMPTLIFLGLLILLIFALIPAKYSFAYVSNQEPNLSTLSFVNVNPLDYLEDLFKNTNIQSKGIGTTTPAIDFSQFLNIQNLSSGDITTTLKAVAVLAINLFLIVIQTVTGILKALLPFLG